MDLGYKLKNENLRNGANCFSKLFFGWTTKLIYKGIYNRLKVSDLCNPQKKDHSELLADSLEKNWKNELFRAAKTKNKPSFFRALVKTFIKDFMIHGIMWFILYAVLGCLQPLVLAKLISVFSKKYEEQVKNEMYFYSAALIVIQCLTVFGYHHTVFGLAAIGMRIRIASSALIYRKITKLSQKALGQTAAGQVVNLLSNDVVRFDMALIPLHSLWVMPFQMVLLSVVIWSQVGVSSLAGIFSMALISIPLQGYLAKLMSDYRSSISKKTDNRVMLMDEIVSGIQVIKMYAWEKPFENIVKLARTAEIKDITVASYLRGLFGSCMVFLDRLALFFSVVCYVLIGNKITAEKVFSLAQSFNNLQLAVAIWYPNAISLGAEALISIKRIQEFLLLKERQDAIIDDMNKPGVIFSGLNASWTEKRTTLKNVNLKIPPGILCAVIGPVGAGKSSLLQVILGELVATSGKVQLGGKISYSSQEPWLFQSTVRSNILFGQAYEKSYYDKIVKVCALERDFQQFPQGDKTIVGERGVSLSGGQRARINLARAIYREADVYLLDDPLSAVDTHVGKHLFNQCITNYLKGKTRILVTHQLQYLKKANLIVVVNEGKIEAQGTFVELSQRKLDFTKMLVDNDETTENSEDSYFERKQSNVSAKFSRSLSLQPTQIIQRIQSDISKSFRYNHISMSEGSASFPKRRMSTFSIAHSEISQSMEYSQQQTNEEESGNDPNSKPFKHYLLATKNISLIIFLIFLMILSQTFCVCSDLWVAFWTSKEEKRQSHSTLHLSDNETHHTNYINEEIFDYLLIDNHLLKVIKTKYAIYFYTFLIGGAVIFTISRAFLFYKMCMISSKNLHSWMFHKLLQAPMRFFDKNPTGRILNRFSKDIGAIDEMLPRLLMDAVGIFLVAIGILVNVSVSNPYLIITIVVMGAIFFKFRKWYVAVSRDLKHLEGTNKSPVFSHINSTLNGIITIRASKAEYNLIKEFDGHQDLHTSAWYLLIACMSSFGLWLDVMCLIFIACVIISFDILQTVSAVNGSFVGLAISQSMVLTGMLQYAMRQYADCINQLTSVERVLQYTKLETEGPFETPEENVPKNKWPTEGLVEFNDLVLKYSEDDPPVLKNLNFKILPGQKVGIVGRTGAGKSSLISALFRLASIEGTISIDGVDTKSLGLTDLRKKISIIPQEPVLFSATLRYNLDPFNEYRDEEIWKALEHVELRDSVESLDFIVSEGGSNFSLGQRQLVCLARAALRNNTILVLDEATANVDPRTDFFIQATIRRRFKDCTVLTIAHRLNTIMDSDKVLVMNFGNMVEFDHPHKLVQIPNGHLHNLVLETGPVMSLQLKDIAMKAYFTTENKENIK